MVAYSNEEFVLLKHGSCAFMVNHQTDSVRLLTEVDANETIHSMTYDPIHQKVWIGTDKGLRYCQLDTKECQSFETPLFNHVSYLTMDSKRRLWISAQNILFSYSIAENKFSSWSTSDGYKSFIDIALDVDQMAICLMKSYPNIPRYATITLSIYAVHKDWLE